MVAQKGALQISGWHQSQYPLAAHTTYRVGGTADLYVRPASISDVQSVIRWVRARELPLFVLGGGANILVADKGIRGVVIDMTDLCAVEIDQHRCTFGAGICIEDAATIAARNGLGGLHHFYGMPGTLGGAVWMNARCYGRSIAELLEEVIFYDVDGQRRRMAVRERDFSYKQSPFQQRQTIMVRVTVRGIPAEPLALQRAMRGYVRDRYQKGHYDGPSAGSVFKNDHRFGRPSGAIIDSLGLRGYRIGGAQVSEKHANIFVNAGGASADDFRRLMEMVQQKVKNAYDISLEREVQYVGEW